MGNPTISRMLSSRMTRNTRSRRALSITANIMQRLVTRVLLLPSAAVDNSMRVENEKVPHALREARRIVSEQTSATGPLTKTSTRSPTRRSSRSSSASETTDALNVFLRWAPKSLARLSRHARRPQGAHSRGDVERRGSRGAAFQNRRGSGVGQPAVNATEMFIRAALETT